VLSPARLPRRAGENAAVHSLRGQLLVAGPSLLDPNFHRTVVLLGEHGADGAMGVVLNRPTSVAVAEAVPPLAALVDEGDVVHVGGPVQPQAVVVLADFVDPAAAESIVLDTVGFLPGEIEDAAELGRLRSVRVFAGYAGWASGQLEDEVAEGSWLVFPAGASDVFSVKPEDLWSEVLRRQGGAYAVLSLLPDDPRVN
jgi:putative transcriptional regulator